MPEPGKPPTLYLIPSLLGEHSDVNTLPPLLGDIVRRLTHFIVEDLRSARRFLKAVDRSLVLDRLSFFILNEHTAPGEMAAFLKPLHEGHDTGLISDAGLPCVADPGSQLVSLAHQAGFTVRPLPGPSSVYLALMASGFNGQHFIFHGYLPAERKQRIQKIREIEADIIKNDRTQVFIETPYRNRQLMESLVDTCRENTMLCVASNLACEAERVEVKMIGRWREGIPDLNKIPAVFLLYR